MHETLSRRLREENRKKWGIADLILIDGGKGQLSAALRAREEAGVSQIPMVGLAKREEEIIIHKQQSVRGADIVRIQDKASKMGAYTTESEEFISILLPPNSHVVKLLQRIRDESHRFAVSYHSTLKRSRQTSSLLDEIPGVGPTTRKKLIRHFGSARGVMNAEVVELQKVLGTKKGEVVARFIAAYR